MQPQRCRFFFSLLASVAELERNLIGERTALALAHMKARRVGDSHAPIGFNRVDDRLEESQEELAIVRRIQAERAAGRSLQAIANELNQRGTGKSWNPMLAGKADSVRTDQDYLVWEVFGNRAVRQGEWKLRWQIKPYGKSDWELFNVTKDPAERKDLAAERPDKLREMLALWANYVKQAWNSAN